jgi:hypothetical protein
MTSQPKEKKYNTELDKPTVEEFDGRKYITSTPPQEAEWEKRFDENVNFDEAELGSNWSMDDVKAFIRQLLQEQKKKFKEALGEMELLSEKDVIDLTMQDLDALFVAKKVRNAFRKEVLTKIEKGGEI